MKFPFMFIGILVIVTFCAAAAFMYAGFSVGTVINDSITKNADNHVFNTPHKVKFHISPEGAGIGVSAWASDKLPLTGGKTDNNSEIILDVLPSVEYNVVIGIGIPQCSYQITPKESFYDIICGEQHGE